MLDRKTLAAGLAGALIASVTLAFTQRSQWPAQYDYSIMRVKPVDVAANDAKIEQQRIDVERQLNARARDGWELDIAAGQFVVLRRPAR